MQNIKFDNCIHKRYWISEYSKKNIPLPSIEEQQAVVAEIDVIEEENNKLKQQIEK